MCAMYNILSEISIKNRTLYTHERPYEKLKRKLIISCNCSISGDHKLICLRTHSTVLPALFLFKSLPRKMFIDRKLSFPSPPDGKCKSCCICYKLSKGCRPFASQSFAKKTKLPIPIECGRNLCTNHSNKS
jgi:hypothetical protein